MIIYFLAFVVAGCMSFEWQSGKLACGTEGECPPSFTCDKGRCVYEDGEVSTESTGDRSTEGDTGNKQTDDDAIWCGDTLCSPLGECDFVKCEKKDGDFVCVHEANQGKCMGAECGAVECDSENFTCRYVPDDSNCKSDGECLEAICALEKNDEPPSCTTVYDSWLCDPGHTCSEATEFNCVPGDCALATVGKEAQLSDSSGKSYYPTVSKSDSGFAVAWVDDVNSNDYGFLYFELFDDRGAPIPGTLKILETSTSVRYPQLMYLGDNKGFAVVYQGWNAKTSKHEIYLFLMNSVGNPDGVLYKISEELGSHSYYPAAALHKDTRRVGIVWTDEQNSITSKNEQKEIYAAVFSIGEKLLVAKNQRVTKTVPEEYWPAIVATKNGFIVAMHRKTDNVIATRTLNVNGVLGNELTLVSSSGSATRPIAMATDGDETVGIAWRDTTLGSSKPRIVFSLLDNDGKPLTGVGSSTVVGRALISKRYELEKSDYAGGLDLTFDTAEKSFVVAWDMVPSNDSGDPNEADIFLARIGAESGVAESPWQMSVDENRSIMPQIAMDGGFGLVAWHDNRDEVDPNTFIGEVYKTTFSCNN